MLALRVTVDSFEKEVTLTQQLVIADFYTDGCIPCRSMSAVLDEFSDECLTNVKIVKINVNTDTSLAKKYSIYSVPTLVILKKGIELERITEMISKDELQDIVLPLLDE